jgi:hypothetical protein
MVGAWLTAGCSAFAPGQAPQGPIRLENGADETEAIRLAQHAVLREELDERFDIRSARIVRHEDAACADQHWVVLFASQPPFGRLQGYGVLVAKRTGAIDREMPVSFVNRAWNRLLEGVDQC